MAGTAQRWTATEHIAFIQQRHQAGHCPALSRTLPKLYHRTTASKPAWPFWVLHFRWRLRNASHFWLCFLVSLYFLLFFLHSFPIFPFAVLEGSYCEWRAFEISLVLLFLSTGGERKIPRENYFWGHKKQHVLIGSPHTAIKHSWEHKTCLLPTICTSWEICSCQSRKWGQTQENGSCDPWMHAQLLGLKVPFPQQLWANISKTETGEALKQPPSTATGFSLADLSGNLRSLLSKGARTKDLGLALPLIGVDWLS